MTTKPTLTIIRGLPGSGKTTLAKQIGQPYFEADQWFETCDGGYHFDPAQLPQAHARCLERVKNSLEDGLDTTVSNTFSRCWEMQPYFDLGYPVRIIEVHGPWKSVHNVPEKSISAMRDRWEVAYV